MKEKGAHALSRALSDWCTFGDGSFEDFINRAALGLYSEYASDYASFAFIVRRLDGSTFVGLPRELEALPAETLLGLLVEEKGGRVACRVKDHSLDAIRFIDGRFRTSIVLRVRFPDGCMVGSEGALWFGLSNSATSQLVDRAHLIADVVSEWFEVHGSVLKGFRSLRLALRSNQEKLFEMRMLAHDARAPIAALQYLIADVVRAHPEMHDEVCRLQEEISYVDGLLSKFTPRTDEGQGTRCVCPDVWAVIHRVCERFAPEAALKRCSLQIDGDDFSSIAAGIPELELERVLSNVIVNAVRHAESGSVVIGCLQGGPDEILVKVSDSGPGFSQDMLDNFELAVAPEEGLPGAHGWGLGLVSCKRALSSRGGDCKLSNGKQGAIVEIHLPAARRTTAPTQVRRQEGIRHSTTSGGTSDMPVRLELPIKNDSANGEKSLPCVLVVDDDVDHSASLARLLQRGGVRVTSFTDVEAAFAALASSNVRGVVCDVQMPDGGSQRLLRLVGSAGLNARVAVMSGELGEDELYELAALGASEFFQKPIDHERLLQWLHAVQGPVDAARVSGAFA